MFNYLHDEKKLTIKEIGKVQGERYLAQKSCGGMSRHVPGGGKQQVWQG